MAKWLKRWIPNPRVLCLKHVGGSKVDSAFHPSELDQMITRNFWNSVIKSKLSLLIVAL